MKVRSFLRTLRAPPDPYFYDQGLAELQTKLANLILGLKTQPEQDGVPGGDPNVVEMNGLGGADAGSWGGQQANGAGGGWGGTSPNAASGWGGNPSPGPAGGWGANPSPSAAGGWGNNASPSTAAAAAGGWGSSNSVGGGWGSPTQQASGWNV
jgi:DNA-directed RNA polymerase II subunit RPB3